MSEATWIDLLRQEAERTSISAAARRIGYSRPAVSAAIKGKYPGDTRRLEARVLAVLGALISCPHTRDAMHVEECRRWRARPMPMGSADDLKHWRACRTCAAWKAFEEKNDDEVV